MKQIPEFTSEIDRQKWFITNADYFTAITRYNRQNIREEKPTLAEAKAYAKAALSKNPAYRSFMIYAVVNGSDTFVQAVLRTNDNHNPA